MHISDQCTERFRIFVFIEMNRRKRARTFKQASEISIAPNLHHAQSRS